VSFLSRYYDLVGAGGAGTGKAFYRFVALLALIAAGVVVLCFVYVWVLFAIAYVFHSAG
jgi:hypothetical protein